MIGSSKAGLIKNITIGKNVWNILFQILNAEFSPLWFVKIFNAFCDCFSNSILRNQK